MADVEYLLWQSYHMLQDQMVLQCMNLSQIRLNEQLLAELDNMDRLSLNIHT